MFIVLHLFQNIWVDRLKLKKFKAVDLIQAVFEMSCSMNARILCKKHVKREGHTTLSSVHTRQGLFNVCDTPETHK